MDGQLPIGVPSIEAVHFSAIWSFPGGWTLRVHARDSGRSWTDSQVAVYDHLSTEELLQVLEDEARVRLG